MTCTRCGHSSPDSAVFCVNCGRKMEPGCWECGADNPAEASFCHSCGSNLKTQREQQGESSHTPLAGAQMSCPRCMRVNEPGSVYCYNCGLPLDGVAPSATGQNQERGGFWIRVGASLIDGVLVSLVSAVVAGILFQSWGNDFTGIGVDTLIAASYATIGVSMWARTLGKHWLGLRVVRPDGSRVGPWRALARFFATYLSAAILFIGFLMVAFRKDRRALHDLICDTVVIRVRN
jgi:uncharacterized RDD family membrane protein YckC